MIFDKFVSRGQPKPPEQNILKLQTQKNYVFMHYVVIKLIYQNLDQDQQLCADGYLYCISSSVIVDSLMITCRHCENVNLKIVII